MKFADGFVVLIIIHVLSVCTCFLFIQGWKPEKNLRFLLQKVLKQSDVGNLGRIVLPKVL